MRHLVNWRMWLVIGPLFNLTFLLLISYAHMYRSYAPYIYTLCVLHICVLSPFLCILQCASDYIEPACEEVPFTEPAEEVGDIYDQLAQEKCIEIPQVALK